MICAKRAVPIEMQFRMLTRVCPWSHELHEGAHYRNNEWTVRVRRRCGFISNYFAGADSGRIWEGGRREIWVMEVPIGYSGKSRWKPVWGEVCIEVDDICKLYCSDVIWKKAKQYYS